MLLGRWSTGALLAPALISACSTCSSPSVSTDAGADSGVKDARVETGLDGSTDVELIDAGFDPFVGSWGPLPGTPTKCGVKVSLAPSKDITPFSWKACASARPGCMTLDTDWTKQPSTTIRFDSRAAREVNGQRYIVYTRVYPALEFPNDPAAFMTIAADLDGQAGFAYGDFVSSALCDGHLVVSSGGALFSLTSEDVAFHFGQATFGQPSTLSVHTHTQADLKLAIGPNGGAVQAIAGTGNTLFLNTSGPYTISLFDNAPNTITFAPNQGPRVQAERPVSVTGGVVALDEEATHGIVYISGTGAVAKVYAPVAPQQVFALDADATDASAFAWLQGNPSGLGFDTVAVWTSPYSTTAVAPRRVTGIDTVYNAGGGLVANAGMVLLLTTATTAELVRLSDGAAWSIASEPNDAWIQPVWVDATEVWIASGPAKYPGVETGLVKLKRADLGAPTIPPK